MNINNIVECAGWEIIFSFVHSMFRGFQIQLDILNLDAFERRGKEMFNAFSSEIRPILNQYLLPNGALNGSKMQDDWFPNADVDIFISHSHADKELAIAFAGWLYEKFEMVAFIDSCIWGHVDDLLYQIDKEHCWNPSTETYNYQKRNRSTAHVHMMLNTALTKMIDHCECLFFLRTPHSTLSNMVRTKTDSAWIYSEISQTQVIRKKIPKRSTTTQLMKAFSGDRMMNESEKKALKVEYFLELGHLPALSDNELRRWDRDWNALENSKTGHALDKLYEIKPLKTRRPL